MLSVHDLRLSVPGRILVESLSFQVAPGDSLAVVGPSGSGKTTLLHSLCGIREVEFGSIEINGFDLSNASEKERSNFRLREVGMVFQDARLLPELSIVENVALPLRLLGKAHAFAIERAISCLQSLGMHTSVNTSLNGLSGGEIQRVAIARALVGAPSFICADEPTGSLDAENSLLVGKLLREVAAGAGAALVVATHDPIVFDQMNHVLDLRQSTSPLA